MSSKRQHKLEAPISAAGGPTHFRRDRFVALAVVCSGRPRPVERARLQTLRSRRHHTRHHPDHMALDRIRYEPDLHSFRVKNVDVKPARDDCIVLPMERVANVSVAHLVNALRRYEDLDGGSVEYVFLSPTPWATFDQDTADREVWLGLSPSGLEVNCGMAVRPEDESSEEQTRNLVAPLLKRHRARWTGQWLDREGAWTTVGAGAELIGGSRSVQELWDLGVELQALLEAASGGALLASSAADLVRAGHVTALLGQAESDFLDAKRDPYVLGSDGSAWELAKDVAAFVNAEREALIVLGISTTPTAGGDVLDKPHPFRLRAFDVTAARAVLRDRVVPLLREVDVGVVEVRAGYGYGYIHIPRQPTELLPFLVTGALVGNNFMGAHLTIPVRTGEDTHALDASAIHSLVAAGRVSLRQRE